MRVLVVAHDHPDWTTGGVEIVARDLARAFDATPGVSARLLVASTSLQRPDAAPGALEAIGEDFAIRTGAYDPLAMLRRDGSGWIAALERVLTAVGPDIVHLHGVDRLGVEIAPAIRRLSPRARIVLTLHDYQLVCAREGLLVAADGRACAGAAPDACARCAPEVGAARHALRRAHLQAALDVVDRFIAPGTELRDRHRDWGVPGELIELLPNPTPAAPPEPPRPPRARPDRFAFFGAIAAHKGVLTLLDAAARLAGEDLRIALHGGFRPGDDAFRREFERRLAAAQPVATHLGPYRREDACKLMRRADWIVTPSLWREGAPLVILEAQAAGRPVICSDGGGLSALVRDGVDGLHAPTGDAAALAETLLAAASDGERWRRLAAAQPARPSLAEVATQHLKLFSTLLETAPA